MSSFRFARRVAVRIAMSIAACGMLPSAISAAEPVAPAPLRQALQAAWQQHPEYRVTEAGLAAARARLAAAGQPLYNPELAFSRDDEGAEKTSSVGVNLMLDLSGKRRARQGAASARLDQFAAEAKVRKRDFARQWLNAWAELDAARERGAIGERRLALVSRFAALAEKQFAADDISGLERDLALLARDEAQAGRAQLQFELAQAEADFLSLGGVPGDLVSPETVSEALLPPAAVGGVPLSDSPDLRAAQASALAAEREVRVARRNRVTDPTIGMYSGRKTYEAGGPTDNVWGVTLTVPLFVRNSYRAEVVAAQAEADAAQAELQRVQLELDADRKRAAASYAAAYDAWNSWKDSRGTDVQHRADLLERLWREGELSTADYLLQLRQTLDTQLAGAELRARLWRTYTDFLATTGRLEGWTGLETTP